MSKKEETVKAGQLKSEIMDCQAEINEVLKKYDCTFIVKFQEDIVLGNQVLMPHIVLSKKDKKE